MRRPRLSPTLALLVALLVSLPGALGGCRGNAVNAARTIDTGLVSVPPISVRTLEAGQGARPHFGDKVLLHFTGRLSDGQTIRDTRAAGRMDSFTIGRSATIRGLELVVSQMRVGETCEARIPWQAAYGASGAEGIPSRSDLVCEVELIQIQSN